MAICSMEMKSRFLSNGVRALLLLPPDEARPHRLLTLLHGAEETPETMLSAFDFLSVAEGLRLAILLPALGNSFCLDWGEGLCARSALLKELLPVAQERSGVSAAREVNAVGGISMGGFGALSLALSEPERFAAAFSLSGALDLKKAAQLFRICQLPPPGDLRQAASRPEAQWDMLLARNTVKPALYLAWGDRDWFVDANCAFARQASECGLSVKTEETSGLHDWTYWGRSLAPALAWVSEMI